MRILDIGGCRRRRGHRALLVLVSCGIAIAGCSTLPGMSSAWIVQSTAARGPYLDTTLSNGSSTLRFFTPASETCRSLLPAEASVEYVNLGPLGQFQQGDAICVPVGIVSLREWRDRQPRPYAPPLPTGQAAYRLAYQDADVALLRGRFPLLALIGWPGMDDTLVVVPQSEACKALIPKGVATIEYRVAGPQPYVLLDDRRNCEVLGLVQPEPPKP
jgi:hypothetical protein